MAIQTQIYQENCYNTSNNGFGVLESGYSNPFLFGNGNDNTNNTLEKTKLPIYMHHQIMGDRQNRLLKYQNLVFDGVSSSSSSSYSAAAYQEGLVKNRKCQNFVEDSLSSSLLVDQLDPGMDQYIRLQNERLRLLMHEQRKRQAGNLLRKLESRTQILLRQKDQEIALATHKTLELENFLKNLEIESQTWQRLAQENEAMVISLNNTLEQLKSRACCSTKHGGCGGGCEDGAESCCYNNGGNRKEDRGDNRGFLEGMDDNNNNNNYNDDDNVNRVVMRCCKKCHFRASCVLFLPCRHLCTCKDCEGVLDFCPVCSTPKKASLEALIS